MLFKSKGIIFKTTKYSESSIILDIYTEEKGFRSFIISGVRKSGSKSQSGIYQVMNIIDVVAYDKSNSLNRIKEAKLAYAFQQIPFDVIRSSIGLFMIDLCRNVIKEKYENKELFTFILDWIQYLDTTDQALNNLHLLFALRLADQIGFEFQDNYSEKECYFNMKNGNYGSTYIPDQYHFDEELSLLLHQLIGYDRTTINGWEINSNQRRSLLNHLITFFKYHVDGFKDLRSLEIFRTVLS